MKLEDLFTELQECTKELQLRAHDINVEIEAFSLALSETGCTARTPNKAHACGAAVFDSANECIGEIGWRKITNKPELVFRTLDPESLDCLATSDWEPLPSRSLEIRSSVLLPYLGEPRNQDLLPENALAELLAILIRRTHLVINVMPGRKVNPHDD